jgi:hypothetical protein
VKDAGARPAFFISYGSPKGRVHRANRLRLPRLWLSTGRGWWDKAGNAALPRFERPSVLELDRLAHDSLPAFGKGREMLPHDRKGQAHLLHDLHVEALPVLLEALQGFGHGGMSSQRARIGMGRKKRPREAGASSALACPAGFVHTPPVDARLAAA